MTTQVVASRIRFGVLLLPVAGIIYALSSLLWGDVLNADVDPEGFAQKVTSASYSAGILGIMISAILYLFGRFALYAYLAGSWVERWALAGLVLVVVFLASYLAILGGIVTNSVAGAAYLEGYRDALQAVAYPEDLPLLIQITYLVMFAVCPVVGFAFLGIAVWRSGTLPRGAAVLLIANGLLTQASKLGTLTDLVQIALLIVADGWVAWAIWKQPFAGAVEAEAQPRVR